MSDARQPGLDLLYSWAAILPSFSFSRLYTSKDTKQDKYGGVKVYEQERVFTSG